MPFTARRITFKQSSDYLSEPLVYQREEVAQSRRGAAIVERARRIASAIEKDARRTAKMSAARAAAARRASAREADRETLLRAAALEAAYRHARQSLMGELEATLDQVLAAALARIGAGLPAEQRLRIVCEQLARIAAPVSPARLRLCTEDASRYRAAGMRADWPIETDDALAPGACRLCTDHGEWALHFEALIEAMSPLVSPQKGITAAGAG